MKSHQRLPEIPLELVTEILTRLPAKSLMRFKSVSKHWLYLICSRNFTNLCLRVSSSPPRLYMSLSFFDNSHLKKILLSSSPSCDSDGTTMSSFDGDQDLTIPAMRGYTSNVFRGLMCFINGPSAQIYNTTTRQLVVLPDIEESSIIAEDDHKIKEIMCFMGHDPVHDQYKVVCIASRRSDEGGEYSFLSEHWVFLLEGDGSTRWKKISCGSPPHLPLTQALNINGRMHYLAVVRMDFVLVIFDIHSEEISVLQVPKDIFWPYAGLLEYCGNIALLNYPNLEKEGVIELWVLEDEEKNMWGSKTLVLHPSQMRMVNSIRLRVQGTTRNGEVILAPRDRILFNIFLYDLQKNHMRKIEIKGTPNRHLTKFCEVVGMDDVENLIYL
ncbi:F-box domain [Arabidopsis thaliana x Arabidopsis arenosa]|uniref:F-box domain n=2 Tax=Arabidopsis TaxID=3701 RepID=A0A8T1XSM5_ARASU|nr:F-box domain [Arabidopsis thaliana x Arabidopsis arenosa]KAG7537265.1 F-box domain [Arabidopsis suecica]